MNQVIVKCYRFHVYRSFGTLHYLLTSMHRMFGAWRLYNVEWESKLDEAGYPYALVQLAFVHKRNQEWLFTYEGIGDERCKIRMYDKASIWARLWMAWKLLWSTLVLSKVFYVDHEGNEVEGSSSLPLLDQGKGAGKDSERGLHEPPEALDG